MHTDSIVLPQWKLVMAMDWPAPSEPGMSGYAACAG
jgi:hypothetical protein